MIKKFLDTKAIWAVEWLIRAIMVLALAASMIFVVAAVVIGIGLATGIAGIHDTRYDAVVSKRQLIDYKMLESERNHLRSEYNESILRTNDKAYELRKCQRKKKCK